MARVQLAQGQPTEALTSCQRAAVIQRRLGDRSREAAAIDLAGQAYQQLDRHDEAADFHRRAVSVHRQLKDLWQLAIALHHLATALDHDGRHGQARRCWREAVALLAEFEDLPATELRGRVTLALPDT